MSHRPGRLRPLLDEGQVLANPDSIGLLIDVVDGRITCTDPGVTAGYLRDENPSDASPWRAYQIRS